MKHKVIFDLTVNSFWPEKEHSWLPSFPVGGTWITKKLEFEQKTGDLLNDAFSALKDEMGDTPYHIWYWTFEREKETGNV